MKFLALMLRLEWECVDNGGVIIAIVAAGGVDNTLKLSCGLSTPDLPAIILAVAVAAVVGGRNDDGTEESAAANWLLRFENDFLSFACLRGLDSLRVSRAAMAVRCILVNRSTKRLCLISISKALLKIEASFQMLMRSNLLPWEDI
uniref:Uncharacterized protein n=1 Tax=Glossina palpalis gambiensis TaxID=67801 RepID=A0A1B0BSQ7_9MUSC